MAIAGAVISAGLGLLAANAERSAANRQAQAIEQASARYTSMLQGLAAPYQALNTSTVFPRLQDLLSTQYGEMNQPSPYLAAAHRQNLAGIGRGRRMAMAASAIGGRYSPSRLRGGTLAAERTFQEATGRENIGYGLQQEQLRTAAQGRYASTLGTAANLGSKGIGLLSQAGQAQMQGTMSGAGVRAQGTKDYWGGLGALGGSLVGQYLPSPFERQLQEAQSNYYNNPGVGGSGQFDEYGNEFTRPGQYGSIIRRQK